MPQQQLNEKARRLNIQVKAVTDEGSGYLEGYANVFGVVDSYGEETQPGAFARDLPEFVGKGFLLMDHEWSFGEGVIGLIADAREDQNGLWFRAQFHSTPQAQQVRQVVAERLAAGKEVGLSIGYWVIESESVTRDGEHICLLTRLLVKEVSVVVAQANAPSTVTGVKQTREDHAATLADFADQYIKRVLEINDLGRPDSWKQERVEELRSLASKLNNAADTLQPKSAAIEEDDDGDSLAALALLEVELAISGQRQ